MSDNKQRALIQGIKQFVAEFFCYDAQEDQEGSNDGGCRKTALIYVA